MPVRGLYTIGEVARMSGVRASTLRYYESINQLIFKAQQMKGWLEILAHCDCSDLDECTMSAAQARREFKL